MSVIYHEEDGDLTHLSDKVVGIIGYGNLGRPIAQNLRDSGVQLQIGVRADETKTVALQDGFTVRNIKEIVPHSHILLLLIPDEVMPQVYIDQISPYLLKGQTLIFASGYNIAFGYVEPPPFVDVGMIAPRTFGLAVRERYLNQQGFYSFVGVGQDATKHAWDTVLALTKAIGSLKAGAVEVTLEQEVALDLFIQQAILPAVHHIMTTAAHVLLEHGYPAEATMMDLYISGEFIDYMDNARQQGLLHALRLSSLTGQYGIFSRLERFNELKLERLMEITLDEIRSGDFAKEWSREYADGYPRLLKLLQQQERIDLWDIEQDTIDAIIPPNIDDSAFE